VVQFYISCYLEKGNSFQTTVIITHNSLQHTVPVWKQKWIPAFTMWTITSGPSGSCFIGLIYTVAITGCYRKITTKFNLWQNSELFIAESWCLHVCSQLPGNNCLPISAICMYMVKNSLLNSQKSLHIISDIVVHVVLACRRFVTCF